MPWPADLDDPAGDQSAQPDRRTTASITARPRGSATPLEWRLRRRLDRLAAVPVARREQPDRAAEPGPGHVTVAPDLVPPGQHVTASVDVGGDADHRGRPEGLPAELVGARPDHL